MEKRQFSHINDNYDGPTVKEQRKLYWGEKIEKLYYFRGRFLGRENKTLLFSDYSRGKVN